MPEYRLARKRAAARARDGARRRPGRARCGRGSSRLDAIHYPLTVALPRLDVPTAVTVYDLQHLDLPQLFTRAERLFRARMHEGSARRAQAVIVNSQFVRRSVVERLGVPPERVHAIPLGLDHERLRPGDESREGFLLYPARPWPHKNHERLFEAFALLRRERPELRARADRRRPRGPARPAGRDRQGPRLRRRARVALPPRRLPGLPQPVRGLRPAAAGGDGLRLPGGGVEHPRGRGGVRRRRSALRPERARGHRGRRRRRPRRARALRSRRPRAGGHVHVGGDSAAGTKPSTDTLA